MTQEEILDRIEKVAIVNTFSDILSNIICEEIEDIRKEIAEQARMEQA
jgi:hypothetical protein